MNVKRWVMASVAVFVTLFVVEMVIHGMMLQNIYQELAALWRPEEEMQKLMWCMWLGYAIFSPFFVLIYSKGIEEGKSGIGQGLRFGLLVGLAFSPMMALGWYAILAIPVKLAFYWFLAGLVEYGICGVAAGLVYRK